MAQTGHRPVVTHVRPRTEPCSPISRIFDFGPCPGTKSGRMTSWRPEFTVVRGWLRQLEVRTLFITPASPWENDYNESFRGTLGASS